MKDISEFSAVNNIYSDFFSHHQPARAAFQVAALPKEGDIEIEAVAIIGEIKLSQLAFQELYFILGAVDVGSVLMNKTYFSSLWYNF